MFSDSRNVSWDLKKTRRDLVGIYTICTVAVIHPEMLEMYLGVQKC